MKRRTIVITVVIILTLLLLAKLFINPAKIAQSRFEQNDALVQEQLAYHYGVMAYLYGYPIVDMHKQLHNETHIVSNDQQVYAPLNRFYRYPELIEPETAGNLRAPNNDTLYFSGWVDVSENPVILHTPNTNDRYFTIAVTNQYAEVEHIGRSTTGTKEALYSITSEAWEGAPPPGMQHITLNTPRGWLLGRLLVDGVADFPLAERLLNEFWLASSTEGVLGTRPTMPAKQRALPLEPLNSLAFFEILNEQLKVLSARPDEAAILAQFDEIGIGPTQEFDQTALTEATRDGLLRALEDGQKIVTASTLRKIKSYNGWMISKDIGRYGYKFMHRAAVVKGGYGNLPEESLYPAALFDNNGNILNGKSHYRLHFNKDELPPVAGFWSIAAYTFDSKLIPNKIRRYSIGDRTKGLQYGEDGSLTLHFQHQQPRAGTSNWLPVPKGRYFIVARLYQPAESVLNFEYLLPELTLVDD